MNKQFAKLKVYELGSGVAFAEQAATVPFLVLPKGQATMKPWGASGFVFENVITGDVIAFVDTLDDVLDSAGVVYGITQIAVMTAVSAFFFLSSDVSAPLYAKGTYNTFFYSTVITAYNAFPTNVLYYVDFHIFEKTIVDAIRFATNNSPVGQMSFTLYSATDSGLPDQKIIEVTFNTATVAGTQIITFAEQELLSGNYFWAIQSNSPVLFWAAPKNSNEFSTLGKNAVNQSLTLLSITANVYTTPTPTTATAPNSTLYSDGSSIFFVQSRIKA